MRRKNLKIKEPSQNLFDANYIASFLGISLNALYLRMHFDNFPKAIKVNGKLLFDLNLVLTYMQKGKEEKAYIFLVQDEIRSLIDLGKTTRYDIGVAIKAKNPSVAGGAIYLRPTSLERAKILHSYFEKNGIKFEISNEKSYYDQQHERIEYISSVWENLCSWIDKKLITFEEISKWINTNETKRLGVSFYKFGPSYKISKIIKLKGLQKELL